MTKVHRCDEPEKPGLIYNLYDKVIYRGEEGNRTCVFLFASHTTHQFSPPELTNAKTWEG